jgi:hypothetical protein
LEPAHHTRTFTEAWPTLVRKFLAEEWLRIPAGVALGFLLAALRKLLLSDVVFRSTIAKRWQESTIRTTFSGFSNYQVELAGILAAVTIIALALSMPLIVKIINSWFHGIVSGLSVLWAFSFFYYFGFGLWTLGEKLTRALILGFCFSVLSATLHLVARIQQSKTPPIEPLLSPHTGNQKLEERLSDLDGDSPIQEWSEDLLSRYALVDSLAATILVSQAPVVAVEGEYGDGKSSVLNLLRKRLSGHAIVVTFRTWLPGSEETLARDLFSDISSECRRLY